MVEEGAVHFPVNSSVPAAVSEPMLRHLVHAHVGAPSTSLDQKWDSLPSALSGLLVPGVDTPVDSMHSVRGLPFKVDHHTPKALRDILIAPTTKNPSNFGQKIKALAHRRMHTCQGKFHTDERKPSMCRDLPRPLCVNCATLYAYGVPGPGKRLIGFAVLDRELANSGEDKLASKLKWIKRGTREVLVGYITATGAESSTFRVEPSMPVDDLELIGKHVLEQPYAFGGFPMGYSTRRLLDPCNPSAAYKERYVPPRMNPERMAEWRAADERGIIQKKTGVYKVSRWVQPTDGFDARGASFVFTASYVYSTALLELKAALDGTHPTISLALKVELTASGGAESPTIAPVAKGVVTVLGAQFESFRSVWYAIRRARQGRLARKKEVGSKSAVTLHVKGNPLSSTAVARDTPAWTAVLAASPANGNLVRRPSLCFFEWALQSAAEVIVNDDFTAAELYPVAAPDVAAFLERVRTKTFPELPFYSAADVPTIAAKFCALPAGREGGASLPCVDGNVL